MNTLIKCIINDKLSRNCCIIYWQIYIYFFKLKRYRWLLLDMMRFHYLGQTNKCRRVDKVDINMQITGKKCCNGGRGVNLTSK